MQAIQNLGLATIALSAGLIVDNYGYLWLEVFFIFWLILATIASVGLWLIDLYCNSGYLNMSARERKTFEEQKRQDEDLLEATNISIKIFWLSLNMTYWLNCRMLFFVILY